MDVLVERIAEPMDEADGAETGVRRCIWAAFEQFLLYHPQQDLQDRRHRRRIGLTCSFSAPFWPGPSRTESQ